MSDERARFDGSSEELVALIEPYVKKPCWITYGELLDKSPTKPQLITPRKDLIRGLFQLCPNGSFKDLQMQEVFSRQLVDGMDASTAQPPEPSTGPGPAPSANCP